MRRLLTSVVSALALGWLNGGAMAQQHTIPLPKLTGGNAKSEAIAQPPAAQHPYDGQACGPHGCDWGCDDHGRGGTFLAGGGIYYIQPNFETNPAYGVSKTTGITSTFRQVDFTYGLDVAPLAWIGYLSDCGFGGRVRWFQYDQGSSINVSPQTGETITPADPLGIGGSLPSGLPSFSKTTDKLTFESGLAVNVWDFELMQHIACGQWDLLLAGGLRYAHVAQNFVAATNATVFGPLEAKVRPEIRSGHNFNGAGPTVALDARRFLGHGGLALYANSRLSILFGSGEEIAQGFLFNPTTGALVAQAINSREQSDILPIGELEVGVEFGRDLDDNGSRAFVQLGLVGQVYWGGGNAANVESIFTQGADGTNNFGFVGLVLRAGLTY